MVVTARDSGAADALIGAALDLRARDRRSGEPEPGQQQAA
jgi:hypothetical protein